MARFLFTQFQNVELIVENGNPIGGAVVETMVWINSLHENGHEIDQFKYANDKRVKLSNYGFIKLFPVYHPTKGIRWLRWPLYRLPNIYKAIKRSKPDYLYASIPGWASYYIALFCRKLGVKMILRVANDNMLDERIKITHSKFDQIFIAKAFKLADFISVQNEFQYQTLKKQFPDKKILKIYNPIKIDKSKNIVKKEMKGYLGWVANFRYQKNLKQLFEIASTFPDEKIKIAGIPLKNMDDETKEYLEKLKELSNVEFVGKVPREEIFNFLSKAKFLLSTSRYEGFSNTFLEAMVVGTPILTPTLVNPDGIIDRFDLGITYQNATDLKNSFNKLTVDEYIKISSNTIQFVNNNHDHLVLGKKLVNFLKE